MPGDAIGAADDGAVGAWVRGEGWEAVVDALGVDGLGWGGHGYGGMRTDREKVWSSCSWEREMRSEHPQRLAAGFAGFKK